MAETVTSHQYAKQLRALADALETAPEFNLPRYWGAYSPKAGIAQFDYHHDKAGFLSAVKAVGSGTKKEMYGGGEPEFHFFAFNGLLRLAIYRDVICRIVKPAQPAEYECEPLLSQAEEAQIA